MSVTESVQGVDRVQLGRMSFNTASQAKMAALIVQWLASPARTGKTVAYVNPHVYNLSTEFPQVKQWLENCDLVCVDGIGVKLALRCMRGSSVDRVVAEELFRDVLLQSGYSARALLVGVEPEEVKLAAAALNHVKSGIAVIDGIDGFSADEEYKKLFSANPAIDLILIGAGTPRSESIGAIAQNCCSNAMCWHIGAGTIKTWAGTKRRAPAWISRAGVQWLHRMLFEPHTRTRYISGSLKFVSSLFYLQKKRDS